MKAHLHSLDTYGAHFKRVTHVPDKQWAHTSLTDEAQTLVAEAIRYSTSALVFGTQGRGKSSAIGMALRTLLPGTDVEPLLLQCRTELRGRQLLVDLYVQLLGVEPRKGMTPSQLAASLQRALSEQPRIVVIDDAQLANPKAVLTMALLCAEITTTFGLIIIGTPELQARLRREVLSRGGGELWAQSLRDDDVVQVLHDYHPLFRTAQDDDLREWNRTHARGEFRFWARTLGRAWDLRDVSDGVLNEELFDTAVFNAPAGIVEAAR